MPGWGWVYRENRVPHYQREFQKHDGLRIWQKGRGRWMMPAYNALVWGTFSFSMYSMVRLFLGHKTLWGKN